MSLNSDLTASLGGAPLVGAATWVEHALLGTVATTVAVIAVAWLGYLTLAGRIEIRRALTTLLGCFVLFGAPSIALGLLGLVEGAVGQRPADVSMMTVPAPLATPAAQPKPALDDPYAGASVPPAR